MKIVRLLLLLFLIPVAASSQQLTGLWAGQLSNDSNTIRRDQSFELALTQYRDKVYGYSYSSFLVHDTLLYIVKRVKGTVDGDVCVVKDEEITSSNFPVRPDKGVHQEYTFRLSRADSTWRLDGTWRTNRTKTFYSISGTVKAAEQKDLSQSKLFPHLQELNLTDAVATLLPRPASRDLVTPNSPDAAAEKKAGAPDKTTARQPAQQPARNEPAPQTQTTPDLHEVADASPRSGGKNRRSREEKKQQAGESQAGQQPGTLPSLPQPQKQQPATAVSQPPRQSAADVARRTTQLTQTILVESDSLQLALYDNGEIDGDTVSLLLNGRVILASQELKAVALRKTIYMPADPGDSASLVLYAENLGKYPPNTGLLIIHDGQQVYQIRFSADLQRNASVLFRRKKKP
ncbi:MAG TPA: hypothetical protein VG870_00445 [Chitinophagaceae bacterium]|nr:hypothetical protein [Chitinophagaceae bacterium]